MSGVKCFVNVVELPFFRFVLLLFPFVTKLLQASYRMVACCTARRDGREYIVELPFNGSHSVWFAWAGDRVKCPSNLWNNLVDKGN